MNKFIFHFSHHLLYLYMKRLFILLLIVLLCIPGFTQIRNDVPRYNPDSVREELDKRPYFSLYKDNYFIGGTTIGSKPTNKNSDVKFQLSISQRLTKSKLPFDTYLYNLYAKSILECLSRISPDVRSQLQSRHRAIASGHTSK